MAKRDTDALKKQYEEFLNYTERQKDGVAGLKQVFDELKSPLTTMVNSIVKMVDATNDLNKNFLAGRTRIEEMSQAIADSAAGVSRLGGSLSDVNATIQQIAEGSRRNVIANEEVVSKLYAGSQILGLSAKDLTENFAKVGFDVSQIGVNLEESIEYVQSLGLNARTVTNDVVKNLDVMNKFSFTDGVQGIARMAAQASMLRFDMKTTLDFADKLLDPEKATTTVASFQRLGLAVGDLADPLKLMNDALNNPGAIQDSLVNAVKQFTYFDEKAQQFRINPQGLLTLRELSKETGLSYDEMTKLAISTADLDKRLSQISPSLQFKNEDDKKLVANLATTKGGDYVVKIQSEEGPQDVKLQNLTQEQVNLLRKQQENAPKTLEDIQRSTLSATDLIQSDVRAIRDAIFLGAASSRQIVQNAEGIRNISVGVSSEIQKMIPESSEIRTGTQNIISEMGKILEKGARGEISMTDVQKRVLGYENKMTDMFKNLGTEGVDKMKEILKNSASKLQGQSLSENMWRKFAETATGEKINVRGYDRPIRQRMNVSEPIQTNLSQMRNLQRQENISSSVNKTVNGQIDMGGTITIKIDAPAGVSEQVFRQYFDSEEFKKKVYTYVQEKSSDLEKQKR